MNLNVRIVVKLCHQQKLPFYFHFMCVWGIADVQCILGESQGSFTLRYSNSNKHLSVKYFIYTGGDKCTVKEGKGRQRT